MGQGKRDLELGIKSTRQGLVTVTDSVIDSAPRLERASKGNRKLFRQTASIREIHQGHNCSGKEEKNNVAGLESERMYKYKKAFGKVEDWSQLGWVVLKMKERGGNKS